jgi:hypothetical protein
MALPASRIETDQGTLLYTERFVCLKVVWVNDRTPALLLADVCCLRVDARSFETVAGLN